MAFDISPYADIQHKDSYLSNAVLSAQIKDSVTKPFNPIAHTGVDDLNIAEQPYKWLVLFSFVCDPKIFI